MAFFDSLISGIGKGVDTIFNIQNANRNYRLQKQAMTKGIQMKVEDARAAGIHPLFALGASTYSPSPISVSTDFGGAGQDLSRAVAASANTGERALQKQGIELDLEGKKLQNEILKQRLASGAALIRQGAGPAKPKVTDLRLGGDLVSANPGWSDAQDVENRHGDLAGSLYGVLSVPADAWYNGVTKGGIKNWYDSHAADRAAGWSKVKRIYNVGQYYVDHPPY